MVLIPAAGEYCPPRCSKIQSRNHLRCVDRLCRCRDEGGDAPLTGKEERAEYNAAMQTQARGKKLSSESDNLKGDVKMKTHWLLLLTVVF